jgi:hypothetical protein
MTGYVVVDEAHLARLVLIAAAAQGLVETLNQTGGLTEDLPTAFSCGEADAFAALLEAVEPGVGRAFLESHAVDDDEGDSDHELLEVTP